MRSRLTTRTSTSGEKEKEERRSFLREVIESSVWRAPRGRAARGESEPPQCERERERMKTHAIGREARAHEACVVLGIW